MLLRRLMVVMAVILVFSVAISGVSYADGYKQGSKCSKKSGMEDKVLGKIMTAIKNKKALDLSDTQVKKLKEMKYSLKKEVITKDAEKDLVYLEIKNKMWEDKIDVDAVNKLIDKKYDIKKEKAKTVVATCAALKDTLSKEQYEKMKELDDGKSKACKKCGR